MDKPQTGFFGYFRENGGRYKDNVVSIFINTDGFPCKDQRFIVDTMIKHNNII